LRGREREGGGVGDNLCGRVQIVFFQTHPPPIEQHSMVRECVRSRVREGCEWERGRRKGENRGERGNRVDTAREIETKQGDREAGRERHRVMERTGEGGVCGGRRMRMI
jgi:hypothetical protein